MLGLLHTSPVHVGTFDTLRNEEAPGLPVRHLVAQQLLDRARREGPSAVVEDVRMLVTDLVHRGATAVLCTCSTIGAIAEGLTGADGVGVPVLRLDRPMAAAAVAAPRPAGAAGTRVAVLAAVSSTIGPTVALIEEEADRAGRSVVVTSTVVADAWSAFESGDHAGYSAKVAAALSRVDGADVIVLAQASMARAADGWAGPVPVLCSPRPGFRAAAAVAADSGEETRDRLL